MEKKKILFVSTNKQFGGSEVMWTNLAVLLQKRNYNIECFIEDWKTVPKIFNHFKEQNIKIYKKRIIYKKGIKKIISDLRNRHNFYYSTNINKVMDEFQPRLIVISIGDHSNGEFVNIASSAKNKNIPYIILVQLATDLRVIDDGHSEKLNQSYLNAKKSYFLCQENLTKTEMHIGAKIPNYEFFNSPFDIDKLSKPSLEYKGSDDFFYLGMVTNLACFHKGQDLLLDVLAQEKWRSRNIKLNIYGHGMNERLLKRTCKNFQLDDMVNFLGHVESADAIWSQNHACIFTSRMEGQSLAMLDAISCGRMVISTDVGDANNLILDHKTGYLIPAPTPFFIDQVLEEAWTNRNNWIEMGTAGRQYLKTKITKDPIEDMAQRIIQEL